MTGPRDHALAGPAAEFFRALQDEITRRLEAVDGAARFREDEWQRPGGGGGRTRVLADGAVFERAGVNFSAVEGDLPAAFAASIPGEGTAFYATGISLVLHPRSPHVPTVHANFRFLARPGNAWFGGGADLTPYYPRLEDVRHFHETLRAACDRHDPGHYPRFKRWADDYFFLAHRGETRGVGGIFFDDLAGDLDRTFAFVKDAGRAFVPAYVPIAERRRDEPFTAAERDFQLWRRGRYVEFNLVYDRGTLFGLKTAGRTESILMSLPPLVSWRYDFHPAPGTPEARAMECLRPIDWLGLGDGTAAVPDDLA
jgi:coproporphyrinogen III oxidase